MTELRIISHSSFLKIFTEKKVPIKVGRCTIVFRVRYQIETYPLPT